MLVDLGSMQSWQVDFYPVPIEILIVQARIGQARRRAPHVTGHWQVDVPPTT